mgnify:CR=1 FL=1
MGMRLRIVSFNAAIQDLRVFGHSLYCPVAWPRERLRQLPAALATLDADVICLQELFHRPLQRWLCAQMAAAFPYVAGLDTSRPPLRLGNELLVLSRFPLHGARLHRFVQAAPEEQRFTCKGFLDLKVEIPGLGAVGLVNFHATAGGARAHPESEEMEAIRSQQVAQLLGIADPDLPILMVGDLNAGPHTSTHIYKELCGRGLVDVFAAAGGDGMTWDPANPLVARGRESHLPPQRIDHVFLSATLADRLAPRAAHTVLHEHDAPTPWGGMPLSDHYGVLTDLEF